MPLTSRLGQEGRLFMHGDGPMANITRNGSPAISWRLLGWGAALALLIAPFIAMQFSQEINWDGEDFVFVAVMLAVAGALAEVAVRMSPRWDYRAAFALGVLGMCMVVVVALAVGIVGSEGNPANLWFFGALLIGVIGALAARLRAGGMALAMYATALAIIAALFIAQAGPTDEPWVPATFEWAGTSLFVMIFAASGLLFSRAARLG